MKNILAIDIGAGSGRVIMGAYDGEQLTLKEVGRFSHPLSRDENGFSYWNFHHILSQVKDCIRELSTGGAAIHSLGTDSFSPDFCLFDQEGRICGPMYSYHNYMDMPFPGELLSAVDEDGFWEATGNGPSSIAFLAQLYRLQCTKAYACAPDNTVLPLANALAFSLSGSAATDFTCLSESLLNDRISGSWHDGLCKTLLRQPAVLPPVLDCGTVLGAMKDGGPRPPLVIHTGMHDTASANYALSALAQDQLCMNAGTWISVGFKVDSPIISDTARRLGTSNSGLADRSYMHCSIFPGTWYLQRYRQCLHDAGTQATFGELSAAARREPSCGCPINADNMAYFGSGPDLSALVKQAVYEQYGMRLQSEGQVLRCIYEGIAQTAARHISEVEAVVNRRSHSIFMGGGAIKDSLLCQLIEEYSGKHIVRCMEEASAVGNMLQQLEGTGAFASPDKRLAMLHGLIGQGHSQI